MILHSEVNSLNKPSPVEVSSPSGPTGEFSPAAPAEQPLKAGDQVRIGSGSTVWEVVELWTTADGDLATLRSGWNRTTVKRDRLVRA